MEIGDEALQAAESALMARYGERFDIMARAILEAAAPHIAAQALQEAATALELQPSKLRHQYVAALRLYAEEPWRLEA
jgi:hypothetical protein